MTSQIYSRIAIFFNDMAKTGEAPDEIIMGPSTKTRKTQRSSSKFETLSFIQSYGKILLICIIGRSGEKMQRKIPIPQAAYQGGRNTTEHVFACKLLAEKAVTLVDYETTIYLTCPKPSTQCRSIS